MGRPLSAVQPPSVGPDEKWSRVLAAGSESAGEAETQSAAFQSAPSQGLCVGGALPLSATQRLSVRSKVPPQRERPLDPLSFLLTHLVSLHLETSRRSRTAR
ncbi:hypothetical protein AAFF_G00196590 [Aldrovandia affinis]|uniref:Uncharacterized protein n=1 Tax=Aldrovandia affinis TaxID=143900 RepID=A0AAD7RIW0_9TELE|nr:hypothetical protein AAFF_G00196590 [Aldrovandia affinis]